MNTTSLEEYGITEQQYAIYKAYKENLEARQKQEEKFVDRFYYIFNYVISAGLLLYVFIKGHLVQQMAQVFTSSGFWAVVLVTTVLLVLSVFLVFLIRMLTGVYITVVFANLGLHKLFKPLFINTQPSIKKESYFEIIEQYELESKGKKDISENLE